MDVRADDPADLVRGECSLVGDEVYATLKNPLGLTLIIR